MADRAAGNERERTLIDVMESESSHVLSPFLEHT
jgi:hypothetical protein